MPTTSHLGEFLACGCRCEIARVAEAIQAGRATIYVVVHNRLRLNPTPKGSVADQRVFAKFLRDRCAKDQHTEASAAEVLAAFTAWAQCNGHERWTAKRVGLLLKANGFSSRKFGGRIRYQGLRLKRVADSDVAVFAGAAVSVAQKSSHPPKNGRICLSVSR